jgi:membrane protein YqaA with SNARE-associated domain
LDRFGRRFRVSGMDFSAAHAPLLLCVLVLVVAAVSSLLPVSPVEALLVGIASSLPASLVVPVAIVAAVGHMAAKTLVYVASRGAAAPTVSARHEAALGRVRALLSRRRSVQLVTVMVSAVTGLPPFYLVTVCCGVLRLSLRDYLIAGAVGRGLRFAVLASVPGLF